MTGAILSFPQHPLWHLTHHRVGRVVDVADFVLDALAEQGAGGAEVEAVVGDEPAGEFGGGVLEGLVERAGVAAGEDLGD